jgi:hypothetical protein
MEAIQGPDAATTRDGRGRRRALALAIFTTGLLAMSAGSANAATAPTCPTGAASIKPTSYTLGIPPLTRTVTDMTGQVNQGDLVAASVTINANCNNGVDVTLVVYNAPSATWDPNTANRQQVYAIAGNSTQHLSPGPHPNALQVSVPVGCFQIDLVQGQAIQTFDPPHNITYSPQKRLVDSDGGDPGCVALV